MTNLQTALIRYREMHNLNQTQLAELIGCTRNAIANWETGRTTPKAEVFKTIAAKLDCDLDYLLGKTDTPTTTTGSSTQPNDVLIALHNQTKGLSEDQLKQVMSYVEFLKSQEQK